MLPALPLASRFLVTLVATAVLPLSAYGWFSLRSMREQIDEQVVRVFLPQLATDHAAQLDAHLARVDQACAVVREIARRALASPATELAAFAEQLELVPDLLDNDLDLLLLADPQGRVVYWQDGERLDPSAHGRRAALIPQRVADEPWFRQAQEQRGAVWLPWGRSALLHRGLDHRSMDPHDYHLGIALDVPRPEGPPGVLFALLRWAEVQRIVDRARNVLVDAARLPGAEVFVVDDEGTVIAHTDRQRYGLPVAPAPLGIALASAAAAGRAVADGPAGTPLRVGYAPCAGSGPRRFVVAVAVPDAELFASSLDFERKLLAAIAVTIAAMVVWSLWNSRAITAPIRALLAATRRIAGGDLAVAVAARGGPELAELARSFNRMATELAAGRERLAAAQRDQAWAEMARQVAHEVKNPLQPMRMVAQLLQRARAEQDPRAEAVADRLARTVLEQTQELDRIASDFRAFAGVAPAARAVVRLDDWLAELRLRCAGLFAGKPLELTVVPGAGAAAVAIDGNALARVFVNLLQNAADAAPDGVRVAIASTAAAGLARITVTDSGPGIPDAVRARLFEPYFTTKTSGTGLGLAICRRLVEAHGGAIRLVGSAAGRTEFAIELPLAAAPAP